MNKILTAMIASVAACMCLGASAATANATAADASVGASAPALTKAEAKDLKTQSDAEFKARKKVADANKELNKADCDTSLEGSAKRACHSDARATAKQDKAQAKVLHETEKAAIKDGTH